MGVTGVANIHANKYTDVTATSSAETIKASSITVYAIEIDNRQNTVAVYIKLYAASPTVGTTHPYYVIKCPALTRSLRVFSLPAGIAEAALYMACVTTPGTGGSTSPTNPVEVNLWTN